MTNTPARPRRRMLSFPGPNSVFALACLLYAVASAASETLWSLSEMLYLAVRIAAAGIVVFLWRPKLLHANRPLAFVAATLATIVVFALLDEGVDMLLFPAGSERHSVDWDGVSWAIVNGWTAVITILALVLFIDGLEERQRLAQLEKLEKSAQLAALHQQLNPHILLNGLNNIYALISSKSEFAADAVLELSDILRYALYETDQRAVALTREVELLRNYIAMQKLGLEGRVDVQFDISGPVEDLQVAPLVFLPIVENAFKHGANTDQTDVVNLRFRLSVSEDRIQFHSTNPSHGHPDSSGTRGVGLENVRARLQLAYGDRHVLETRQQGDTYQVDLTLFGAPK
ncbi:histidine kinase [Ruegeria sp.]|uniref:sensor histidine kinase n=1 Tax=Ruegeria sp. TaxID=1879320 RepID=UPI00231F3A41|nr:histidine kinase [Ruegeria sp.]MDA7965597.1 histidine kinase [Ruegeria sp.]